MSKHESVFLHLTKDQKELLVPLFNKVNEACPDRQGILMAQIWPYGVECRFLEHETAKHVITVLKERGYYEQNSKH